MSRSNAFDFEAQLDDFLHTIHEIVERLSLCMATRKTGHRGDVEALVITLDYNVERTF